MANARTAVQVGPVEVEEKLNHLEYVVDGTVKTLTSFKKRSLGDQTRDFLELMRVVKDAIGIYRDEVADQQGAESGEDTG